MFINATVVIGTSRGFSCSIETTQNAGAKFTPLDLNPYSVRFRILGSPTADAKVLVEHIITQNTDFETEGQIDNPEAGQFTFVVSKEDTKVLGLGHYPMMLELVDPDTLETQYIITEGKENGEFNKINVVEV